MSKILICVTGCVQPAFVCGKYISAGHYASTCPPNSFMLAMPTGIIDLYHFMLWSVYSATAIVEELLDCLVRALMFILCWVGDAQQK